MTHEGATRLWGEVMKRALEDARGDVTPSESPNRDRDEARNWLRAVDNSPGGFDFACDALCVDPGRARRAMTRAAEVKHD